VAAQAGGLRRWQAERTRSSATGAVVQRSGCLEVGLSDHELETELARLRRGVLLGTMCAATAALAVGRRSAMEPLQDQVGALQRFTADASHELRHPLTMVRTLGATTLPESASGEVLAHIDAVEVRMARLLDDLRSLKAAAVGERQLGLELEAPGADGGAGGGAAGAAGAVDHQPAGQCAALQPGRRGGAAGGGSAGLEGEGGGR
jgi:signal transduction histidine kinase